MGLLQVDVEDVFEKVKQWTPGVSALEKGYEDSLYEYLNQCFPKEKFERQYARGKTRADLYVAFKRGGANVAIELKRNLQERGDYHRLIGQIWEYLDEWKVEVLVVLCGKTDPALAKCIADFVDFMNTMRKVRLLTIVASGVPAGT